MTTPAGPPDRYGPPDQHRPTQYGRPDQYGGAAPAPMPPSPPPGPPRRPPVWAWVVVGVLAVATILVWALPLLRPDPDEPPTASGTTDASATPDPTGDATSTPDSASDDVVGLQEPAVDAGFTADGVSLWITEPPSGFVLRDPDPSQPGLVFESTPGCTVALTQFEVETDVADDAAATDASIAEITRNLAELNEDLTTTADTSVVLLPIGEDGSAGEIEFATFAVEYRTTAGDVPTGASVLLRTFHDLGATVMLTYTCPTADASLEFDEVLDSGLWVQP